MDNYSFEDLLNLAPEIDNTEKRTRDKKISNKNKLAEGKKISSKNKLAGEKREQIGRPSSIIQFEEPIITTLNINETVIETCKFDGVPVLKEDWKQLVQLRETLDAQKASKEEINAQLKKLRHKAARSLKLLKKKFCLGCGRPGHVLQNCTYFRNESGVEVDVIQSGGKNSHERHQFAKKRKPKSAENSLCIVCEQRGHTVENCPAASSDEDIGKPPDKKNTKLLMKRLKRKLKKVF